MDIKINNLIMSDIQDISKDFSNRFDPFWSINILKEDFQNENSIYITAKLNNEIVGFAGIKIILDEANIMNIVTIKEKRNLGIGSLLLENLIRIVIEKHCASITLEVNEKNSFAIHLYEKYDFKRIGLRKKYYNNTDNAIIMTKKLSSLL